MTQHIDPCDDQWIFDLAAAHESSYGPITFRSAGLVAFVNAISTRLAATTQASTAQADVLELATQLRAAHDREIWGWGYLLSAADMLEKLAATSSTDSALAAEARDAVLEEVADALELLNDPAGDAAAYDNRDMDGYELERMNAIQHCVNTVLALRSATATGSGDE